MLLISLMLAAAPTPAAKPGTEPRREVARPRRASTALQSKRLIELEAAVNSLPVTAAERGRGTDIKGM